MVKHFNGDLSVAGGLARFGNDDGYGCGLPEVVIPTLARLEVALSVECGLTLQRQKTEVPGRSSGGEKGRQGGGKCVHGGRDMEQVFSILPQDNQALWVALHRSQTITIHR